jgi:hypothetical protein
MLRFRFRVLARIMVRAQVMVRFWIKAGNMARNTARLGLGLVLS